MSQIIEPFTFVIGPFTKENFNINKWKLICEKIYRLNSANEEETIPYCQEFLQLVLELNQCEDYNQYFGEPSIKQFFYQEVFGRNAKNLIATRTFNDSNLLDISNSTLLNLIKFWLRAFKEDDPHLAEMAKNILEPQHYYYKSNNLEYFTASSIPSFSKEPAEEHTNWIESLKEGELVDAIKDEPVCHRMAWLPARVSYVMDIYVKISFLHDPERSNKYLNKISNANHIAPYQSKCKDFEWRVNLKPNDEIDACNNSSHWCSATIMDVRESEEENEYPVKEVLVGYRVYDEEGDREDLERGTYFGYPRQYDEWLSISDPRLAKKGTMVKGDVTKKASNNEENKLDDTNDHIYTAGGEKVYAITRQSYCRSLFFVKMVNEFGELGGFKMILDRIQDTENWAPIEVVTFYLAIIGNISNLLHREFANEYIPVLRKAVWKNLLQSPDSNIRNFTKEKLDDIVSAFETLLKRIYKYDELYESLETLSLELCVLCFDSNFLERKLQGLKSLQEMISALKVGNFRFYTAEHMNNFIRKNQIFEKIYGSKGHTQLIQRSSDLLRYMVSENVIGLAELESAWNATRKGDTETKLAIYKLFSNLSIHFKEEQIEFIIEKISEIEPSEMIPDEIELVYELSRFSSKSSTYTNKAKEFFWKIICDPENLYPTEIREPALYKFCYIMRSWDLIEERVTVLYDCVENIKNGTAVLASLKVLRKIIDNYPTNVASIEKFTKSSCIEHLSTEKNLLIILLQDLRHFKADIKKKLGSKANSENVPEELLDTLTAERTSYITHITERLEFIHYVVSNAGARKSTGLNYDLLSELWDIVVRDALTPSERNAIYKWIQETADSKSGFPMSMEDLIRFFKEKMVPKEDYEKINSEGFDCLKGVFLLVNEKMAGLSKVGTAEEASSPIRHYGPQNYDYYNTNNDNNPKEKGFGFIVNISPEDLEGVQSIWDLTLTATSEEVAEKARNLINDLYFNLNDELSEEIVAIRGQYLNKCLKSLQETLASKDQMDASVFTPKCLRCIALISKILDESEKKGVGSLKSHSALIKGELLTFSVTNEVSWGSEVPRKVDLRLHSNITIYELRVKVSKHFKVTWDEIKLLRAQNKEIKDNENGRTLGDLRIRNGEELTANKRPTNVIPQVDLVDSNGQINPVAKKIFLEWFETYSENGKMNREQCAAFINSCTNDCRSGDDYRVKDVFNNNDLDRDGVLTLEDFMNFYKNSCKYRPHVVWSNLHSHQYRNDLKKANEIKEEKVDITLLPRYILTTNTEYFQIFFSLLDFGSKIAIETWKLLNRLPTSHQVFSEIVRLKGIRDSSTIEKDWSQVLDPSSGFKLLYALQVIEYLMEDELDFESLEDQNNQNSEPTDQSSYLLWAKDPELMQFKKTWQADFIYYGGFDYLFKIFHNYSAKDHKSLGIFDKNILSFILKILSNYLAATFAATVPNIYRCLSFIRLFHLNLDFIQTYMNKRFKKDKNEPLSADKPQDSIKQEQEGENSEGDMKIEETEEFRTLVERLKGELGSHILQTIDFKEMIKVVSELGYDVLTQTVELESEDRIILEYSLNILVSIFLYDNQTIKHFLELGSSDNNQRNSDQLVLEGIFCSRSFNVRNYFSHAIYVLVKDANPVESTRLSTHYIRLFLKNIPSSNETRRDDCNQYFEILCKLIEETYNKATTIDEGSLNFENLIGLVVQRIKDHVSSEDRSNLHIVDKAFVGLLQLCEKIVSVKPELKDSLGAPDKYNMIEEIFDVCLFDTRDTDGEFKDLVSIKGTYGSAANPVKCKSTESRYIAYKLLLTLCKGHQTNLNILLKRLQGLMGSIMKLNASQDWNYSPSNDTKSLYGYVGIKNPRCICYMNAMLQQFFMTPTFRYGILAADDKKQPNLVKNQEGKLVDDNLLHQIQQMFGFLELSDRQDFDSLEFCFAFKDHSGQPVNISIQQDTQEFLNMIFDKLENGLKETPFKHILQGVYGGKTTNQTICHGCGTVREREDIFYNLSVEVKNMKNIYESFEKFIAGETIEDYYCESCKKKNSITKRTCLSSLPNVLIVHLQRIIFDLDTLMNQKINSKLEFPFELNMEPYTKEHLAKKDKTKKKAANTSQEKRAENEDDIEISQPQKNISESVEEDTDKNSPTKTNNAPEVEEHEKEYYQYKLVGVLVHDGTAEFGHYYSYINTNRSDLRGHGPGSSEKDKWLEYNDSMIRSFNTKNIENECFGGESTESNDDYWAWGKYGRDNSKNAYILVYERVTKDPLKLTVTSEEDEAYLKRVLNVEEVQKENPGAIQVIKEEIESEGEKKTAITYQCDYYGLKGFVPGQIYHKVWESNHKFMFEKHIYSDGFFGFIKDVCKSLHLPDVIQPTFYIIHPEHTTVSQEIKENLFNLIQIISRLVFHLLAKSEENNIIGELAHMLKYLFSLVPESVFAFFKSLVEQDRNYILALFLNCPSRQVRHYTSISILYSINIMILYYNLTLDLTQLQHKKDNFETLNEKEQEACIVETAIVEFLDFLIESIPIEAGKNWTKVCQFFEFWREFSTSGEIQIGYLYQKQFIAVLIDFYLGTKSPLIGFSDKKHAIGGRYTEPELNSLIQTLAVMTQRANVNSKSGNVPFTSLSFQGVKTYNLSENEWACITCVDFYEKAMKDKYDFQALGIIIQHFCFENEDLSYNLAKSVLYGINRSNFDDIQPYLEGMSYLVIIRDGLQTNRLEWIFGFPQQALTVGVFGSDSFGLYGNYSLEAQVVTYETPINLQNYSSFTNFMLSNRKRIENLSIVCLKQLLILADLNDFILNYILSLPPPSYNYGKFTDWMPVFIEYFLEECRKYYSSESKEQLGNETKRLYEAFEKKVNQRLEAHERELQLTLLGEDVERTNENNETEATSEEEKSKDTVLRGFFPNYIIGKTFKVEEIDKKVVSKIQDSYEIQIRTNEIYCYITDSKPTGDHNLAFPSHFIEENSLRNYEVKPDSPISLFIQPRGVHPNLEKKNIQNVLQEEIEAALAQANDSTQSNTSGSPDQNKRLLDFSDAETGEQIQIQEDKVVESEGLNPKASKLSESAQDRVIEIERNLPMDKDFDFTYEVNPVVRRFFIKNESPFTIYGQFAIVPKSNNFLNFRIPCSFFNLSLKPHSNNCVLTIAKIFPSLGWGDYEVKFYMFERDSNQDKDHNEKKESFLTKILNSKREQFTQDRLIDLHNL